jgi:predicted rRNA methylase YqxC with S4 and FtsJ domains
MLWRTYIIETLYIADQCAQLELNQWPADGFKCIGIFALPIEGGSGNKELLGYFQRVGQL